MSVPLCVAITCLLTAVVLLAEGAVERTLTNKDSRALTNKDMHTPTFVKEYIA